MTIIGDLFVSVRPETTGFEKDLESKLQGIGSAATGGKSGALGALSGIGAGVAVALVAAGAASIKLAADFQSSVANIASNADISVAAADKIGKAFLGTAGTSIFSATQLSNAFASVAGPLEEMQGKALNAKQALDFMRTASDLAEASQTDLGTATKTLASVMQTFQIPVKDAASASNQLFNTSRATGVGIDQLGSTIDRLKSRLGVAAPSLSNMGTLLVDLQNHGVTGSRGLLVVNTALTTLLKSADSVGPAVAKTVDAASKAAATSGTALAAAQQKLSDVQARIGAAATPSIAQQQALATATQAVTDAQQRLAASADPTVAQQQAVTNAQQKLADLQQRMAASAGGTLAQQQELQNAQDAVAAATAKHAAATAALTAAQNGLSPSLSASVQGAEQLGLHVFDAQGKFEGLGRVIAQLQPKLKGLTQEQQLQALSSVFGASANKALLNTVLGGTAAWDKASAAVNKANGVHKAAEAQSQTLQRQMQLLRATVTDLGINFGNVLVPKLEDAGKILAKVTEFFEHNKAAAIALGVVVGGFLATALAVFAINMGTKVVGSIERAAKSVGLFGGTVTEEKVPVANLNDTLVSLQATIERLADQLPTLDAGLDETSVSFQALADATTVAGEEMAAGAEVGAEGVDAAIGSTGIGAILIGLGLALTLLLTHWKEVWKLIREAVDVVVQAFKADFDFVKRIFDDVVGFIKEHWKLLAGILIAPLAPALAVFFQFPKQIKKVIDDVVGVFKKAPDEIVHAFGDVTKILENVGKDLLHGLVLGFELISPLFLVLKFKSQIATFFADAGKWLLKVGEELVKGIIKGAIDAPLDGLKKVGDGIVKGFKSVFHIFSPARDTQPIGAALHEGIIKGFSDAAADTSKFDKAAALVKQAITDRLHLIEVQAEACGKAIIDAIAKGIESGASSVVTALGKIGLGNVTAGAGGAAATAAGGKGALDLKKQLLEVAVQQNFRLASLVNFGQVQQSLATSVNALIREGFTELNVVERQGFAFLVERGNIETSLLVSSLQYERLQLTESRSQTVVLRAMLQQMKMPQTLTLKPSTSTTANNANNGTTVTGGKLAQAVLS